MKSAQNIEWTLQMASAEFNIDRKTLSKRLKRLGISATDGWFSTKQIAAAIFGDFEQEKLKNLEKENQLLDFKIGEAAETLIEVDHATKLWEGVCLTVKQKVEGIPNKIESQYRVGISPGDLRKLIELEVNEALNALQKKIEYQSIIKRLPDSEETGEAVPTEAAA